jgi:hypothetical protein
VDPEADHLLEGGVLGVDPDVAEGRDRAGGEAVAADLLARERCLVDDGDVDAVSSQVVGGGRAARPGAHDQDVRVDRMLRAHGSPPRPAPS